MSTGIFQNRLSFVPRLGFKALGLAVLSAGLLLGGCNGKLKDENEALRNQNTEFKEKLTSTESEKAALATQLQTTQSEKDRLAMELATARTAQPTFQPRDTNGDSGWSDKGNSGNKSSGRGTRAASEKTFTIAGDTLFASGSATLKPTAKKSIDALLPQIKSAHNVTVEGYTDSDPVTKSHWKSNTALSKARAEAVTTYLVSKGVSKNKISAVGKGASDPKSTKAESRRVEIVVAE